MPFEPLEVWGHWGAPNPWKVCIILETLALPYTMRFLELTEVKTESYLALTPNGRLPTLKDPNTSLVLWEVSPGIRCPLPRSSIMADVHYSPALSSSTSSSSTTPTREFRTVASPRSGTGSSGLRFRSQVLCGMHSTPRRV
jgi:hypothetical protein